MPTCFPRASAPIVAAAVNLREWFFRSYETAIGSALCFQISDYGNSGTPLTLTGLQIVNSSNRDAYLQIMFAATRAAAIAKPQSIGSNLNQMPLLIPAKSTFIADESTLLKVPLYFFNGDFLFARISESHEVYTPFLRSADGEISGQSTFHT